MRPSRTSRFTSLVLSSLLSLSALAQQPASKQETKQEKAPILAGAAVSVDLVGLGMKAFNARFSNMEVGARINFKEKFFPLAEIGLGDCKREGADNANRFSATAPYFRFGMDYNMNKKHNGNRFFAGARYAFSRFNYDFENASFTDPVYSYNQPLSLTSQHATVQWLELCVGVETKLWSIVRLGWNIRLKARLKENRPEEGSPYFVPGFGRNDTSCWGGTVNLIFDVGKTARKNAGKETAVTKQ